MSDEKEDFVRVELFYGEQSQGSYISHITNLPILDDLEGLSEGDSFKLTKIKMTQAELDAMPEFEGF